MNIFSCSCHLPIVNLFTVTVPITVQQYTERFVELELLNFIIIMRIDFSRIKTHLFHFNLKNLQLTVMTILWTSVLRMNSNYFNVKLSLFVVFNYVHYHLKCPLIITSC